MFFSADFFYFFSHDASDLIDKMANGKSVGYMCDWLVIFVILDMINLLTFWDLSPDNNNNNRFISNLKCNFSLIYIKSQSSW